jgi:hypothetical protein
VLLDVVSQVGKSKGSFSGFFDTWALHLKEVKISVNIKLLLLVVDDMSGWEDAAVS